MVSACPPEPWGPLRTSCFLYSQYTACTGAWNYCQNHTCRILHFPLLNFMRFLSVFFLACCTVCLTVLPPSPHSILTTLPYVIVFKLVQIALHAITEAFSKSLISNGSNIETGVTIEASIRCYSNDHCTLSIMVYTVFCSCYFTFIQFISHHFCYKDSMGYCICILAEFCDIIYDIINRLHYVFLQPVMYISSSLPSHIFFLYKPFVPYTSFIRSVSLFLQVSSPFL